MDYIEDGEMFSTIFKAAQKQDENLQSNWFTDLSRILLSFTKIPRIGSLTIDDQGIVSLSNRPLTRSTSCVGE